MWQRKMLVVQASPLPSLQAGSTAADTTIAQIFQRMHSEQRFNGITCRFDPVFLPYLR
jgi:hypothetical protein